VLLSIKETRRKSALLRPLYISAQALLILFISQAGQAADFRQPEAEFETFKQQSTAEFERRKDEFRHYRQQLLKAFDEYKRQSARIWGERHTVMPRATNWVSYQGDLKHRSVVDFERGTIDVELAVDKSAATSDRDAQRQLASSIVQSLQQGRDNRSMLEIARQPVAISSGPALLQGQVADAQGHATRDYQTLARQAAARAEKSVIRGDDGQQRTVYRAQLKLVPGHIRQRAQRYQQDVNTQAAEQRIPGALVFAIMETESMFNPTARSPAPAFGLMQLVPTGGAREAYRYLHNEDRIVSDRYLYHPGNNIRLGTAFLNRLYYKYLAAIENAESRQWAMIAAYNTGAGNVLRSFAGKYSRSRFGNRANWKRAAFQEINRRTPEQVYSYLRQHLPYRETRRYLHKVRSRMGKYSSEQGA